MERMYRGVRTWTPNPGCEYDCAACKPTFQRQAKRRPCPLCKAYKPHAHLSRLKSIPSGKIIFVNASGDLAFAAENVREQIVEAVRKNALTHPGKLFYFQTKNPNFLYNRLVPLLKGLEGQVILLITLETNRDADYEKYSRAPSPTTRFMTFRAIDWLRKIVTIEPIMDFDHDIFLKELVELKPEAVYIGYNSHPKEVKLPEPSWPKVRTLIEALEAAGIEVRPKDLRRTSCKHRRYGTVCDYPAPNLIPERDCPCDKWVT